MKLDLETLSHTDIWPHLKPCFFLINLVIHVGFQKVRYLWIPSKI